jgi:glycopeptide antibiotics resistance protein
MFLPFGFFISYYLKAEKPTLPLILTFIASIAVEIVQMCIGRVFDVDDILLNLLGGTIGFCIFHVLRRIGNRLPKFFHNEWVLNIGAIIALIGLFTLLI